MPAGEPSPAAESHRDSIQPDETDASRDPLELAAEAILGYLTELAAWRELCRKYEGSFGVRPHPQAVHLVGAAELSPEGELRLVRAELEALRSAGRWRGEQCGEQGLHPGRKPLARYVLWEGEPLFVAVVPEGFGLLRVELIQPHRTELPRLPLAAVAAALRCFEHLLPGWMARAVPCSELASPPPLDLVDYLRRATPERLPSRQCIWPADAAQSATPESTSPPSV